MHARKPVFYEDGLPFLRYGKVMRMKRSLILAVMLGCLCCGTGMGCGSSTKQNGGDTTNPTLKPLPPPGKPGGGGNAPAPPQGGAKGQAQ
jgi:hypothetical protein